VKTRRLPGLLPGIAALWITSIVLAACGPGGGPERLAPDGAAGVAPLPSATPTLSAPNLDEEDPVADCSLQAPICQVGVGVQQVGGVNYLAADLLVQTEAAAPGSPQRLSMDIDVEANGEDGESEQVGLKDHPIGVVDGGDRLLLSTGEQSSGLFIADSGGLVLLSDPRPSPWASAAYDPATGDLLLLDRDANPIATVTAGGVGVLLADSRPSPTFLIPFGTDSGGYKIIGADGGEVAIVDPKDGSATIRGADGGVVAAIDPEDGGVAIRGSDGGEVAIVDPKDNPVSIRSADGSEVATIDPKDNGVTIRGTDGSEVAGIDPKVDLIQWNDPDGGAVGLISSQAAPGLFGPSPGGDALVGGDSLIFLDEQGQPTAGAGIVDGLVVIAAPGVGPVAIVHPEKSSEASLWVTNLIPLAGSLSDTYDLTGSVALYSQTAGGVRQKVDARSIDLIGTEVQGPTAKGTPAPGATPTSQNIKATATSPAPKASLTPSQPKPTATSAPPKPTATSKPPDPTSTSKPPAPTATSKPPKPTATAGK
jgi:hypothetical protein